MKKKDVKKLKATLEALHRNKEHNVSYNDYEEKFVITSPDDTLSMRCTVEEMAFMVLDMKAHAFCCDHPQGSKYKRHIDCWLDDGYNPKWKHTTAANLLKQMPRKGKSKAEQLSLFEF